MTPPASSPRPALPRPPSRRVRPVIAAVAALAAAALFVAWEKHPPKSLLVPAALLALSALLTHHRHTGSQLLARSVWWANLVLGTLLALAGSSSERGFGLSLAITTGAALLIMGRLGLDEDEASAFRPVAFRTALSLGMIMAVADAQALVLFGVLKLEDNWGGGPLPRQMQGLILLAMAALVLIAIAGLYRLRIWGLLLGALCAAGTIVMSSTNVCGLKSPLPAALIATSIVQLALPTPIVAAIVRGRAPAPCAPSRIVRLLPAFVVVVLVAFSVLVVLGLGHALV